MEDTEKQTLTVAEAAQALGISKSAAYAAANKGDLPTIRIGRKILVPKVQLERLLGESA